MYYEKYGVNTCIMDCENRVLRDKCQCVDVYLASPQTGSKQKNQRVHLIPLTISPVDPKICNVEDYVSCAVPTLGKYTRKFFVLD
jgi:hypothetical protein